jgi:succinyl-CoA synthetase beta subunit
MANAHPRTLMNIHEFQSKEIFARYGIPVPRGIVVSTPGEAKAATQELGGRSAVKAQIHAGGRGKAGGVKVVGSPEEAEEAAQRMLASNLVTPQTGPEGAPVQKLLIEELADIKQELYVALTIDRGHRGPAMLVSTKGGMDIEEVAATNPEDIHTEPIDPLSGLMPFQTRRLVRQLGLDQDAAGEAAKVLSALYQVFVENDCTLVEVNPLIITGDGRVVALDAKINVDDDSMFRHPDLLAYRDISQEDPLESQAADLDIAYVNLDGDVGCLVNGAGLAMATLDVTNAAGAAPANFLDVGGGATPEKVASAVKIILSDAKVRRVLVNIFGGILRCDIAGEGIVLAYNETGSTIPMVVRMLGTNVVEGKEILAASGLSVVFADTLTEAADAIKNLNV